jgi:anti-anti-sigma factor
MVDVRVEPVSPVEVRVVLRGCLDREGATRLRATLSTLLNEGQYHTIRLDLRYVDRVDSAGMGTLAVARRVCEITGVRLRMTPIGRHTRTAAEAAA